MKLYQVQFDGESDYVEALTFGAAIEIWRRNLSAQNAHAEWCAAQEPDSVALVSESPVLR